MAIELHPYHVGYEFELLSDDGEREHFEGVETVDAGSPDRAVDTVERWYRDTYGDLAYWNAWLAGAEA